MRTCCFIALAFFLSCQGKEVPEPDFLSIELVNVPAGAFRIGSGKGFLENETPRVLINLNAFQVSKHEITQHQYLTVMNDSPGFNACDNCPVEQVSWYDALKFCNALSEKENLTPAYVITSDTVIWDKTANGYRLPAEAEWECACKAGSDTDLFTGDLDARHLNLVEAHLDAAGWYSTNSNNSTQPVGQKQANTFGLYDMHGNVWEWCWDYFNHDRYVFMDDPSNNPVDERPNTSRVIRGGSFFNDVFNARSALRYQEVPSMKSFAIGFRVVRNAR